MEPEDRQRVVRKLTEMGVANESALSTNFSPTQGEDTEEVDLTPDKNWGWIREREETEREVEDIGITDETSF